MNIEEKIKNLYESSSTTNYNQQNLINICNDIFSDNVIFEDIFSYTKNKQQLIANFSLLRFIGKNIKYDIKHKINISQNKFLIIAETQYESVIPIKLYQYNEYSTDNNGKIVYYKEVWDLNFLNPLRTFFGNLLQFIKL